MKLSEELFNKSKTVTPGLPICRKCSISLNSYSETENESSSTCSQDSDSASVCSQEVDYDIELTRKKAKLDTELILDTLEQTPIKLHGIAQSQKEQYGKEKLRRSSEKLAKVISTAIDSEIPAQTDNDALASDMNEFLHELKLKIDNETNYAKKIQMLTLVPRSWSRKRIADHFNVSEYSVRKAIELRDSEGIMALPAAYTRKRISDDTLQAVQATYEDDEYTRLMPGKSDCVSVKGVKHQKRLILSNMRELYQKFKEQNPDKKIGFSKFCSLRPKWCVYAGSSGTHNVCTCKQHKNAKLMCDVIDKDYKVKLLH